MDPYLEWDISHILFYTITALWLFESIFFPKLKPADYQERQSFFHILLTIISNLFFTLLLTYYGTFRLTEFPWELLKYLGLLFYSIGIFLRYSSLYLLGNYFSRDVHVEKGQFLVSHGPYKILRHPLYLGLYFLVLGVPTFFQNPLAMVLALISMARVLNKRMKLEEKNMEKVLGKKYRHWKKSRYRFIPYIY